MTVQVYIWKLVDGSEIIGEYCYTNNKMKNPLMVVMDPINGFTLADPLIMSSSDYLLISKDKMIFSYRPSVVVEEYYKNAYLYHRSDEKRQSIHDQVADATISIQSAMNKKKERGGSTLQ